MNDVSASFPTTSRNRVKRLHERGSYDHAAVFAVLDAGLLCHVAYTFDGQPYCTPTIHWREGDMLYWHGSSASRMLRQLRGGTPACLTVSHLDGLVLARTGFNHSANYRSAMCFGTARIVDEPEEKMKALAGVVDRFYPGRSETLRPISAQEAKATMVIGMRIEEASAKVRAKGVGDDEEDYGHPVWAGVIPVRTVIGAAEPCPRLLPGIERPRNLAGYAEGERLDQALIKAQRVYEGEG
ncbi:pyridoxamine 5'-phosphate oxidase family protein [Mesorhizobium sp. WSM4307]|nr:pyridoxamine 5'-phosphate oxidase family protein [Mesorhizobium sp. WSM4315]TRC75886.1 pyridoxamine 5'-phosphate oxidase family protein [Mesorhizobium sp. WSM4307]